MGRKKRRSCEECGARTTQAGSLCSSCYSYRDHATYFRCKEGFIKGRCKRLGLRFDLPRGYLYSLLEAQEGRCALTGEMLKIPEKRRRHRSPNLVSVDRINPKEGYVVGNVRLTTLQANQARGPWDDARLLELARMIVRRIDGSQPVD